MRRSRESLSSESAAEAQCVSENTVKFVAMSRFAVANGMEDEVREAFLARPHLVDCAPGFVRMDVIQPVDDASDFVLTTYWSDEASYRQWHRGHHYSESHAGIPKGLKLVRGRTEIRYFHHLCE